MGVITSGFPAYLFPCIFLRAQGLGLAEILDKAHGVVIAAQQQVGSLDRHAQFDWIGDRASRPALDRQRQEGLIEAQAIRQAKRDIAGAQVDVDAEVFAQQVNGLERDEGGLAVRADRQHQRVNDCLLYTSPSPRD